MARAPSAEVLAQYLQIDSARAEKLRGVIRAAHAGTPESVERALNKASVLLGGYGVEPIEADHHVDSYYRHYVLLYVNRGDSYSPTVYFNTDTRTFGVGTWADWVDRNQRRYRIH